MKKKKIVIFGGTGNLGIYFVDYCVSHLDLNKYEIIVIGRKKTDYFKKRNIEYINIDINNKEDFNKLPTENVFCVVNMAGILPAYSKMTNEELIAETNFVGGIRILEYAKKVKSKRILYMQTWSEYAGHWNKKKELGPKLERKLCYSGDHAFYSITKSAVVDSIKYYYEQYGLNYSIFVLPNIYLYSPLKEYYVDGKKKKIAYRYIIDRVSSGKDVELWGNPNAYKDIVYVKDFCQMVFKGMFTNVECGTYFVGTGKKTTLKTQIEGIIKVFGPLNKEVRIIEHPEKQSFTSFVMNIQNAIDDLGYNPEYDYISYLKDYKKEMEQKRFDDIFIKN